MKVAEIKWKKNRSISHDDFFWVLGFVPGIETSVFVITREKKGWDYILEDRVTKESNKIHSYKSLQSCKRKAKSLLRRFVQKLVIKE